MAALITWFVGSLSARMLTGAGQGREVAEEKKPDLPVSSTTDKSKSKGSKNRQKLKKEYDDPKFSTSLSTPIEDIIEETITEDSAILQPSSLKKRVKSNKTLGNKTEVTGVKKSNKKKKEENLNKEKSEDKTLKKNSSISDITETFLIDEVGFSFLPVREKGKKFKNKNDLEKKGHETLDTVEKSPRKEKKDLSKPAVHYKKKAVESVEELPITGTPDTFENIQNFVVVNKLEGNPQRETLIKSDYKESKKVTSAVSYANILTNLLPEKICQDENITKRQIFHSNSNSSSIEILSENTELEQSNHFEGIEENIHKLVNPTTASLEEPLLDSDEKQISHSKSSSICVIDNQTEFEETEDVVKELNLHEDHFVFDCQPENSLLESDINLKQVSESLDEFVKLKGCDKRKGQLEENKKEHSLSDCNTDFSISESLSEFISLEKQLDDTRRGSLVLKLDENVTELPSLNDTSSTYENCLFSDKDLLESPTNICENNTNFIETQSQVPVENFFVEQHSSQSLESPSVCQNNISDSLYEDTALKLEKEIIESFISANKSDFVPPIVKETVKNSTPRSSEGLKEISSKLIEEEKCVKKFSYITGSDLETTNHTKSEELVLEVSANKSGELEVEKMRQIRVLTLNDQEHQECTLYRIEKNWTIQFRLGPSLFGRKIYLYCNYPNGKLVEFDRCKYELLQWVWDQGNENADDTAAYTQITPVVAGSFHFYFGYEKGPNCERQGSGYFLVDPVLKYGENEDLPLDCIQCQSVLTKGLGSFSSWEKKLEVTKQSGYNMIHFTPIQELGESNSSYSLSEQLKLNPIFKKENGEMPSFEEIEEFLSRIRKDWKVTSICDIVLNHTANESEWIREHPEVTYNCSNCPYMRPAYLLDAALYQFSIDIKKGVYEDQGIPIEISHEEHLNAIRYHFSTSVLEPLNISELYICNVKKCIVEFLSLARTVSPVPLDSKKELEKLKLFQDPEYRRLSATIDMDLALKLYNVYWPDTFDEESRLKRCAEEFKSNLESLNTAITEEVNEQLKVAIDNIIAGIRYYRVQADGPKLKDITVKTPLAFRYFTDFGTPKTMKEHEEIMYSDNAKFLMAHNGWVIKSDPLKNFAAPDSKVYLRRELIAWGDSVKLRFGDRPEDCPFLWDHMRKYVEQTARMFDGVRLDNCHSTPIPVAEYLLDCARRVRPDLYVVAELFTNSDMTDNIFVNRLGITSLIREALSAWDSHEEGRLVHRYGGYPVGSFYQPRIRPLVPSIAHALFLDQTHDNPSPVEKRSVFDLLPNTALVNMACCASGSNRGYDELVPHHIHVVDETREYTEWTDDEKLAMGNLRYVTMKSGIISAKRAINDLHFTLGKEGFTQIYVDQMDSDIVAVTRHCPATHQSYILVAFTAFSHPDENTENNQRYIKPLRFEGVLEEIVLEATLNRLNDKSESSNFAKSQNYVKDSKWINGLSEYQVILKQHIQVNESTIFEKVDSGAQNITQLNFKNFKPGYVAVIKASLPEAMRKAIDSIRNLIDEFTLSKETKLAGIISKMSLADLNRTIYRCDKEERDEGYGFDTYNIPNYGFMVYAGLQGAISLLANIRPSNDLGHPLCGNLRDGNWMIEYIWKRLKLDEGTKELGEWIEKNTTCFNDIPRYLVPCYFDVVLTGIYVRLMEHCYSLMSTFVQNGSTFVRGLSLGSVQFAAFIKSANLPALSPNLSPPKPPTRKNDKGEVVQACVTLSAGLPHFAIGFMRNWGRDTFIALRGLFILTGRYQEARQHILGYAACLRHGLIPNLLDGGRNSRFNCRDAVWWWLYCIKEYAEEAPNGISILQDNVSRIFPSDDSVAQPAGVSDQPLYQVIQEALKVHFQGLAFRERNAGRSIDEHMTDQGFNNQIGIHPETGFVFGGNQWNCGTWMDKMGSSDKAGNRGKPATPRDGSAVELIGLSKSVITWLSKLNEENKYPFNGVERTHKNGNITKWTFKEWAEKIKNGFEKYFWINIKPVDGEIRPDLVNKRGIYKDCYGASQEWTDFQLRCNFPIAMVVAPELFIPEHAWIALAQVEKYLLGSLGIKTLDPEDWAYRGDYDNSNDSDDPTVAKGFNYHQGPEWLWPVGFFLRAKLQFAAQNGALKETLATTKLILSKHFVELQTSTWRGLPELTNNNGSYCKDSSRTQAWSMSCILEVLYDLQKIESSISLSDN